MSATQTNQGQSGVGWQPRVAIVLVETTHPGNIGATARAMKTMGLSDLRLVAPRLFPDPAATARAVGADDVLTAARVYPSLIAALAGIDTAYATSARNRHIEWPTSSPRAAAAAIVGSAPGTTAIVFGPEHSGLSNHDLDLCQRLIAIPTVADFSSLNLAQAVQICAYELFVAAPPSRVPASGTRLSERAATATELELLHQHCLRVMTAVEFFQPDRPKLLERRLRRLLSRSQLVEAEVQFLRGFLAAIEARLPR